MDEIDTVAAGIYASGVRKKRRPLQAEDMERVVAMLAKTDLKELDQAATEEGLSRSALIRNIVKRYLRERGAKA